MIAEINNTRIIIKDYIPNLRLEKMLSTWDPVYFRVSYRHYLYSKKKQALVIPGYFPLDLLQDILELDDDQIIYKLNKYPGAEIMINLKVEPRDNTQKKAINFLIDKLHPDFNNYSSAQVGLATGVGKSYITINFITQLATRSIIIVDQDRIGKQWAEYLLNYTNIGEKEIFNISGSNSIEKLLNMKINLPKIYIASHMTLANYASKNKWTSITRLFNHLDLGLKIYDEAHIMWANQFHIDAVTNVWKNIYLTATPRRSDKEENRIYQLSFSDISKFNNEDGDINDNYHIICYININTEAPHKIIEECNKNKYGFDSKKFGDYCFNDRLDWYMELISKIISKTIDKKEGKLAIVVEKNAHVDILHNKLKDIYNDKYTVGRFCGLVGNKKERQKELEKDIIVTNIKSFGKAVDVPKLRFLLCLTTFSSTVIAEQLLGRLRNNFNGSSFYFDVCDVSIRNCLLHRRYRESVLNTKAKKIIKVNY